MKKLPDDDSWFPEPEASLILHLFNGRTPDDPTAFWIKYRYLAPEEERTGRKALADLLRSRKRPGWPGRDPSIERREALFNEACHRLADLIDPDNDGPRKIVFKNRKGRLPQYEADMEIIHSVRMRIIGGLTVEEAVDKVAKHFKLSESRVLKLWSRAQRLSRTSP